MEATEEIREATSTEAQIAEALLGEEAEPAEESAQEVMASGEPCHAWGLTLEPGRTLNARIAQNDYGVEVEISLPVEDFRDSFSEFMGAVIAVAEALC